MGGVTQRGDSGDDQKSSGEAERNRRDRRVPRKGRKETRVRSSSGARGRGVQQRVVDVTSVVGFLCIGRKSSSRTGWTEDLRGYKEGKCGSGGYTPLGSSGGVKGRRSGQRTTSCFVQGTTKTGRGIKRAVSNISAAFLTKMWDALVWGGMGNGGRETDRQRILSAVDFRKGYSCLTRA